MLGGLLLVGSGSAGTSQTARLRLAALSPLTVAGTGFRPLERARVTAWAGGRVQTRRVTATRLGAFRLVFRELSAGRCDLVRVVATGTGSGRVVVKRLPSPACLPARSYD